MKKLLILLFLLIGIASFAQTTGELQTILSTSQTDSYITGQGSQTALNQNVILATAGTGATDAVSGGTISYRAILIHIVPASGTVTAGAITFEGSNDNFVSTALPILLYDMSSQGANPVSTYTLAASTPRYFGGYIPFRYVRARISTGVTGTTTGVQAFTTLSRQDFIPPSWNVTQATAANLNATVTGTINTAPTDITASGNITAANANLTTGVPTANSTVTTATLTGQGTAMIQVTGAFSATIIVQGTRDGSNWSNITQLMAANQSTIGSNGQITSAAVFKANIAGYNLFRVTASAYTSGTATVTIGASSSTGLVSLDAYQGYSSATTALTVTQASEQVQDVLITGQGAQSASGNNIILATAGSAATDVMQGAAGSAVNTTGGISYKSFYIQIIGSVGIASGQVIFEGSNDNTTFTPLPVYDEALVTGVPITAAFSIAASTNRYFSGATRFRYVKCRISTVFAGGTVQAITKFSTQTYVAPALTVAQPTLANLNGTVRITDAGTNIASVKAASTAAASTDQSIVVQLNPIQPSLTTALNINEASYGGTAVVNGGVAGVPSVGGNIAVGTARTANPVTVGGADANNLTRVALLDPLGAQQTYGAGETVAPFAVGTGAAAITDGTNAKTIIINSRESESDVYVYISSISTTPTFQLEASVDNISFRIIPLSRIDNTASGQQFIGGTAATPTITPVAGSVYRGKIYGAIYIRMHLTAGTTTNTTGHIRVVSLQSDSGQTTSALGFTAANTTEAVGSASLNVTGTVLTGGVRTLSNPFRGGGKAVLTVEGSSGTTGTNTLVLEGSTDGTTYTALSLQPLTGGATAASVSFTTATTPFAGGIWEADISQYAFVRARASVVMTTTPYVWGGLKLVSAQASIQKKRTYRAAFVVAAAASATDIFQLIGSATTTVEVTRIFISGTQTTGGVVDVYIKKRSTANTAGTSTASTNVPLVSSDAAATAVGAIYTANPTTGTDVGNIYIQSVPVQLATGSSNGIVEIAFGDRGKPLLLLGVAQALAINLNGVTVAGGSFKVTIEFVEY